MDNVKEIIKAHITTLQALIIAFLSAIFGVFGYVIINIDANFSRLKIFLGFYAFILLVLMFIILIIAYFKMIKKLKECE